MTTPTPNYRGRLKAAFAAQSRVVNGALSPTDKGWRRLDQNEVVEVANGMVEILVREAVEAFKAEHQGAIEHAVRVAKEEWEKRKKTRKKEEIDERAKAIFNLYPRREGGSAALLSISKAIAADGFEAVLNGTTKYAAAVASWPRLYRFTQSKPGEPSRDLVPMATTWFNQNRYNDDPENWTRVGGSPAPKPKPQLSEPAGWRDAFPDFVHVGKPWAEIDATSQAHIIEQIRKSATA